MNNAVNLVLSLLAGVLIGAIFFGGLWWTVRRGLASNLPALWFLGSLLLRTGIALIGFYFVSAGSWQRLLMCLLGSVIARVVVARLVGKPGGHGVPASEVSHAT